MDNEPESRVFVELTGGPFSGRVVDAPRDDEGRILAAIWVRRSLAGSDITAGSWSDVGDDKVGLSRYRFKNWPAERPIYRFAPPGEDVDR